MELARTFLVAVELVKNLSFPLPLLPPSFKENIFFKELKVESKN